MFYLVLLLLFLSIVFGCVSISNSYASAKQAQVAIEISQTAQIALKGQMALNIALTLIVVFLLILLFALLYKLTKKLVLMDSVFMIFQDTNPLVVTTEVVICAPRKG